MGGMISSPVGHASTTGGSDKGYVCRQKGTTRWGLSAAQLSSLPSNGSWSLGEQQSAAVHLAALAENLMLQHSNGLGTCGCYVAVEKFVPSR